MTNTATPNIAMNSVASSNISSHGYDDASQTLAVQFKSGRTYHYTGVPADVAEELTKSDSIGSFFAKSIRPQFTGTLIPDVESEQA